MQNYTISGTTGWHTVNSYTVPGGLVFVLRSVYAQLLDNPTATDIAIAREPWRIMVDNSPALGMDELLIDPMNSLATLDCFVVVGPTHTVKIQKYVTDSNVTVTSADYHCRMYGQLLVSQNVTLPWEPCNVE